MIGKPSLLFFLLALLAPMRAADAAAVARPNLVVILADDMGSGDVSAYNPASAWTTPHLDRLAREGMKFTDAHSSSAVCTPSRYALLTGRYSWRGALKSGVIGGLASSILEPGRLTVPALLRQHGYATAMIGKWHLGLDWVRLAGAEADAGSLPGRRPAKPAPIDSTKPFGGGPVAHGFDFFFGIAASLDMPPYAWLRNDRVDATRSLQPIEGREGLAMWRAGLAAEGFDHADVLPREAQEAVRYLRAQEAGRPFFLYLALTAPHTPILPTTEFAGRTRTTPYGDFCVQVDAVVGQVLAALAERGLERDTLVIFTADNGFAPAADLGALARFKHDPQLGRRGRKFDLYEGGHRVPFVARWPARVPANRTSAELIYLGDLMATCAEIVGARLPDNAGEDSVSLLPVLTGANLAAPLHEAVVHHSNNGSFAIRQGPWKLCLCPDSGGRSEPAPGKAPRNAPPFQLFHLDRDPAEQNNLYAAHPEIVERLGRLLKSYVLNGRSTPGAPQKNTGGTSWPELAWMEHFR